MTLLRWLVMCGLTFQCLGSSASRADDLTLYFFPSRGIDWNSPSTLLASVAKNFYLGDEYLIGHVTVEVKCDSSQDRVHTGMTFGDFSEAKRLILKKGAGVSVLFAALKGALEDTHDIERYLRWDADAGNLSFLRFLISPKTCSRLMLYAREYEERELYQHYGLSLRPRYGEGSGCSAFGVSFLELAGLGDIEFVRATQRNIRVPESWMGFPLRKKFIEPFDLWKNANRWANSSEIAFHLQFWDPDLMYSWVMKKASEIRQGTETRMRVQTWGRSTGIVWDQRAIPTPSEPIWLYSR